MKVKKFEIDNFSQREYAQHIYNKFFDENSEGDIEYLLSFLYSYDIMKPKKIKKFQKKMDEIGNSIKEAIKDHDTKIINNLNKLK